MFALFKIFGIFTGRNYFFRGLNIGIRENEVGIAVNSPLTVFGKLIYNIKE